MQCIFCDKENNAISVDHIVPESLGNKGYVAQKGRVCDSCNSKFSKFEGIALANSIFIMERARLATPTKKGKNAKGKVGNLEIEGHKELEKNIIVVKGLTDENLTEFDPETLVGKLHVQAFDKSEVSVSKLLLKMALSSIFKSQSELFLKYDFGELKRFLANMDNIDWPFMTSNCEVKRFHSIPRFTDKYQLGKLPCELKYCEVDSNTLLFMFTFGSVSMVINLLNRDLGWTVQCGKIDALGMLYPQHYRKKSANLGPKSS